MRVSWHTHKVARRLGWRWMAPTVEQRSRLLYVVGRRLYHWGSFRSDLR